MLKNKIDNTIATIKDQGYCIVPNFLTPEQVDDVKYAFENGNQGDLFIQKSPAVTIKTLAEALLEIYDSKSKIREIGVRHGEKMFETLVTNEEMLTTDDECTSIKFFLSRSIAVL